MDEEPDRLQSLGHKESDTAERLTLFPFNKDLRPLDQRSRPRELQTQGVQLRMPVLQPLPVQLGKARLA